MDGLSDEQLETVFVLCDTQGKGYMNASDLKSGLALTLAGDDCAAEHVANVLGLGPADSLTLREVRSSLNPNPKSVPLTCSPLVHPPRQDGVRRHARAGRGQRRGPVLRREVKQQTLF